MVVPLKKSLSDRDPSVRKTAAFGVAKLFDVIPEAIKNSGLLEDLLALLRDENPMVVSNSIAAIFEIDDRRTTAMFTLDSSTVTPILSASQEWFQTI
jgi:vesicle coat complex subunit